MEKIESASLVAEPPSLKWTVRSKANGRIIAHLEAYELDSELTRIIVTIVTPAPFSTAFKPVEFVWKETLTQARDLAIKRVLEEIEAGEVYADLIGEYEEKCRVAGAVFSQLDYLKRRANGDDLSYLYQMVEWLKDRVWLKTWYKEREHGEWT